MPITLREGSTLPEKPPVRYTIGKLICNGAQSDAYEAYVGTDVTESNKVFLKACLAPTPIVPWFNSYLDYVKKINLVAEKADVSAFCVLAREVFAMNPDPGFLDSEFLYQVFDFIEGGHDLRTLLDKGLGAFSWKDRVIVARIFMYSISRLHEANIVHCDLKPENIQMLPNPGSGLPWIPRLIDMDRSILSNERAPWDRYEGYVGTIGYMSPEHISGKIPSKASDIFTCALILFEVLSGIHPYQSVKAEPEDYKKAVLNEQHTFKKKPCKLLGVNDIESVTHEKIVRVLLQALSCDASCRPTARDIFDVLVEIPQEDIGHDQSTDEDKPSSFILKLKGDKGDKRVFIPTSYGRVFLSEISSDAIYASSEQFIISKDETGWHIETTSHCKNKTMLNEEIITQKTLLKHGDRLCLVGASGNRAMNIEVILE